MKLLEKQRINSKYRKKYDAPQTPYQRVVAYHQDECWQQHDLYF